MHYYLTVRSLYVWWQREVSVNMGGDNLSVVIEDLPYPDTYLFLPL
jgi:hypothetical protein